MEKQKMTEDEMKRIVSLVEDTIGRIEGENHDVSRAFTFALMRAVLARAVDWATRNLEGANDIALALRRAELMSVLVDEMKAKLSELPLFELTSGCPCDACASLNRASGFRTGPVSHH